jgi:hypothetical protein
MAKPNSSNKRKPMKKSKALRRNRRRRSRMRSRAYRTFRVAARGREREARVLAKSSKKSK